MRPSRTEVFSLCRQSPPLDEESGGAILATEREILSHATGTGCDTCATINTSRHGPAPNPGPRQAQGFCQRGDLVRALQRADLAGRSFARGRSVVRLASTTKNTSTPR